MSGRIDFKVVLLGGFAAGKTTLLMRYIKSKFCDRVDSTIAGVFFANAVQSKGRYFKVGIWDTCGQERFRSLVRMYYRDAYAAIVCYDITDSASWASLKHYVEELRDINPDCKVYICGTKKDRTDFDPSLRQVDLSLVSFYTQGIQAKWFETSSVTAENVCEMFQCIVDDFADVFYPNLREDTINLTDSPKKSKCQC